MLNIKSILEYIKNNLQSPRVSILDEEHVLDTATGVELHLYDDYIKATRDEEIIATLSDFTKDEQEVLWDIKKLISDPVTLKDKEDNLIEYAKNRRSRLSSLYENPSPIRHNKIVEEEETSRYTG